MLGATKVCLMLALVVCCVIRVTRGGFDMPVFPIALDWFDGYQVSVDGIFFLFSKEEKRFNKLTEYCTEYDFYNAQLFRPINNYEVRAMLNLIELVEEDKESVYWIPTKEDNGLNKTWVEGYINKLFMQYMSNYEDYCPVVYATDTEVLLEERCDEEYQFICRLIESGQSVQPLRNVPPSTIVLYRGAHITTLLPIPGTQSAHLIQISHPSHLDLIPTTNLDSLTPSATPPSATISNPNIPSTIVPSITNVNPSLGIENPHEKSLTASVIEYPSNNNTHDYTTPVLFPSSAYTDDSSNNTATTSLDLNSTTHNGSFNSDLTSLSSISENATGYFYYVTVHVDPERSSQEQQQGISNSLIINDVTTAHHVTTNAPPIISINQSSNTVAPPTQSPSPPTTAGTTENPLCPCACSLSNSLLAEIQNMTLEVLQELTKSIQKNLTVDTSSLSATIRKNTSAYDSRPSSKLTGMIGVFSLVLTFGSIVVMDLIQLVRFLVKQIARLLVNNKK